MRDHECLYTIYRDNLILIIACVYSKVLIFLFLYLFSGKLGTHGCLRRRGAGHELPMKYICNNFSVNDVKKLIAGMHSTENVNTGRLF